MQLIEAFLPGSPQVFEHQSGGCEPDSGAHGRDDDGAETRRRTGASLCWKTNRLQNNITQLSLKTHYKAITKFYSNLDSMFPCFCV